MGAARYAPGRATTAFTAALCASAATPAFAQPAAPVALDAASDLPTGLCPDGDALRAAVARRLGRAPFEADAARRIDVRWTHARPWRARIAVAAPGSPAVARRIEMGGDDCGPLADAVTLAVTLAIDPDWSPAAASDQPPDAPCPRCAPAVCPAAAPCPPATPTPTSPTAAPRFALRLLAGLSVGVVGGPSPTVGLEGEAVIGGPWSARLAARFSPAAVTPDAAVLVGLTRFDLGVCLDAGRAVAAGACAGLGAGALDLGARAFIPVAPGPRGWLGAWVEGRVEVRALRPWVVGAQLRAVLPWVRYRAVVEGLGAPSFEAPAAGFEAELSTGVRF